MAVVVRLADRKRLQGEVGGRRGPPPDSRGEFDAASRRSVLDLDRPRRRRRLGDGHTRATLLNRGCSAALSATSSFSSDLDATLAGAVTVEPVLSRRRRDEEEMDSGASRRRPGCRTLRRARPGDTELGPDDHHSRQVALDPIDLRGTRPRPSPVGRRERSASTGRTARAGKPESRHMGSPMSTSSTTRSLRAGRPAGTDPGSSVILVVAGTVTNYIGDDPTCTGHAYSAGSGFTDPGGTDVHMLRNRGPSRRRRSPCSPSKGRRSANGHAGPGQLRFLNVDRLAGELARPTTHGEAPLVRGLSVASCLPTSRFALSFPPPPWGRVQLAGRGYSARDRPHSIAWYPAST